jgi:hypothetical protein
MIAIKNCATAGENKMKPYTPFLTRRFDFALQVASGLHFKQLRKDTGVPYIAHLLAVCSLVFEAGGDKDEVVAALLHHAVEDQGGLSTLDTIRHLFGDRVAAGVMSAIYSHAIRWEFFGRNPIASVRQTAKRRCEPEVLTIDELKALLSELEGIYRTMVYTAGVTGCRVSEVAGLRWQDCCFEAGEIRLRQGWVRTHETEMKTEASKKPVPLESDLAEVLMNWRAECAYNKQRTSCFPLRRKRAHSRSGRTLHWKSTSNLLLFGLG